MKLYSKLPSFFFWRGIKDLSPKVEGKLQEGALLTLPCCVLSAENATRPLTSAHELHTEIHECISLIVLLTQSTILSAI